MADNDAAFIGAIPQNYDRYLGPMLFQGHAEDIAARVAVRPGVQVLEVACGTGIVTRRLFDRLRGQGSLVATDLNEAMLAHGRREIAPDPSLQWRQADATKLPFADGAFDAVVCQFGLMFFPDKAAGIREAFRVLRSGGQYLFNVWDAIEHNPITRITHETVAEFFPTDPPQFYRVPFSLHEPEPLVRMLGEAGFEAIEWRRLDKTGTGPSAAEAATGLIDGNPIVDAIMQRRPDAPPEIKNALAANIATELGDRPVRCPLRAVVFSARRP